jgi:hypothetical protein
MLQSPFVKLCNQCNGSGETRDFHETMEVCSKCKGAKYEVDGNYLEYFKHKIWEVSSKEIAPYIRLIRDVDEGIEFVKSLPRYPNSFLSQLYYIRGQLFEFLVAFTNEPAYHREAVVSLTIANELGGKAAEDD